MHRLLPPFSILAVLLPVLISRAEKRPTSAPRETPITADDRRHWSFRPLKRPAVPNVRNRNWPRNAIDRFVLDRLEKSKLKPAAEADRVTLIRRVSYDLIGLPPSPDDVAAFVADRSPNAYEKLVDRLLASPEFGERQALYWLDLTRFAETDGFEHDKVRKTAWRYRDWVIGALNSDMPYDEFVRCQLAADQLRPSDSTAQDALGFLSCGPDMPDINSQSERRHSFMNDMTSTVSSVFLALQFGCAQCHDHKYDAISQYDFYRLRAFFDPDFRFQRYRPAGMGNTAKSQTVSHLMIRGDFRRKGPELKPAFPRILAGPDFTPRTTLKNRRAVLANWLTRSNHPLTTRVIVNRLWQIHFGRGLSSASSDFGVMGVEPDYLELLDWLATEFSGTQTGGQIRNPQSAIRNPAAWSMKRMHRLIVTSATYRQSSRAPHDAAGRAAWRVSLKEDPHNALWSRFPRRRLQGEAIRDAMLAISGNLSQRRRGPGVRPPLPKELVATLLRNHWPVSKDERDHRRRSVYVFVRRNLRYPIFHAFDKPDNNTSCARRNRSTTAPQALLLVNSEFSKQAAERLAEFVMQLSRDDRTSQITFAYRRTLGRAPTKAELQLAFRFIANDERRLRHGAAQSDVRRASLAHFCLVLFNLNEFLYID